MMQRNGGNAQDEELASPQKAVSDGLSGFAFLVSSATKPWVVVVAIVAAFVALGLYHVVLQDRPETYDTAAYLLEANRISEKGGVLAFPRMIVEGEWKQANQHPLYILAIAPFAEFDFSFMVSAKLISLLFGVLTLVATYVIAFAYFDRLVAALATVSIALTGLFIRWSAFVACETLLLLLTTLAIGATLAGFRAKRFWALAGLFTGLAYFTKVTALLLLPGFFIAALLTLRGAVFRTREVYMFAVMFLLGASPLLISNVIVHGNPIYNSNIDNLSAPFSGVSYKESSLELGSMIWVRDESLRQSSVSDNSKGAIPEIAGLTTAVVKRIPREFVMFMETFSPWPVNYGPLPLRWLFGASVLLFFLAGVARESNHGARNYALLTLAVFIVALSLHRPIERYLLPVHFLVWLYAAVGMITLVSQISTRFRLEVTGIGTVVQIGIVAFCMSLCIYILGTKNVIPRVMDSVHIAPHRQVLVNWMRENINEHDKYVEGPNIPWVLRNGKFIYPLSDVRSSKPRFLDFISEHEIRYVIAEMESMQLWRYRGRIDRQIKFEGLLEFDSKRGIIEKNIPVNWSKVAIDEEGSVDFIVYEISSSTK